MHNGQHNSQKTVHRFRKMHFSLSYPVRKRERFVVRDNGITYKTAIENTVFDGKSVSHSVEIAMGDLEFGYLHCVLGI